MPMKPVNKSAALKVVEQADTRELYSKYLTVLAQKKGNIVEALTVVTGRTAEELAGQWWTLHREIVTAGAASVSEQEMVRLLGGDRNARLTVLVDLMYTANPGDAVRAIAELNNMDEDVAGQEGESFEDYARLLLGQDDDE